MQTKICIKCEIEKEINKFRSNRSSCKKCEYEKQKQNLSIPEKKKHREEYNKNHWREKKYHYNKLKKQKLLELKKDEIIYNQYLEKNRKTNRESWAKKKNKNINDIDLNRELKKAQKLIDKEFKKLCGTSSVKKGKTFYSGKYKDMRVNDIQYKIKDNMRARIRKALKNQSILKNKSTFDLVGCTGFELTQYLLSLGYNKDIHTVDHIVPMSRFDLTNLDHQLVCCHYLNLQPLSHFDNYSKHNSLINNWQEKIIQICEVRNINPESIISYIASGVLCQS